MGMATAQTKEFRAGAEDELIPLEFDASPALLALIETLAARTDQSPGTVIAKALALYSIAVDAHVRGATLAVLEGDEVASEISGI